jgi:hypothetical protein
VDNLPRWSQIVRQPGAVQIAGFHPTQVPPLDASSGETQPRDGIRLLVYPVDNTPNTATIDITSTAVMAMLEGFLLSGAHVGKQLSWRSTGFSSRRRDTLLFTKVAQ